MNVPGEAVFSRLIATLKRWLAADGARVSLPELRDGIPAEPAPAVAMPPLSIPGVQVPRAADAAAVNFMLAARLKSVAKLNPRKQAARPRVCKRPGKPIANTPRLVKAPRETRHVWLQTRSRPDRLDAAPSTVVQMPQRRSLRRPASDNRIGRAA